MFDKELTRETFIESKVKRYCYFCSAGLANGNWYKNTTASCKKCLNELDKELFDIKMDTRRKSYTSTYL